MRMIAEWGCYYTFSFCHSLRGWETVKATITEFRNQIVDEDRAVELGVPAHIGLPLFGRFKRCGNSNTHMLCMMAGNTASGLSPLKWSKRLLRVIDEDGGPVSDWLFQRPNGSRKMMNDFADMFYDNLSSIQLARPDLIPANEDVLESYALARSFRRGATTRAQIANVPEDVVEWVNRWGTGQEVLVKGSMRVIYSERTQMLDHFLKFSIAL